MTTVRYHLNIKTAWFWISLFVSTLFLAITSHAQSSTRLQQNSHLIRRGYEVSTSIPLYTIQSNIPLYNGLKGSFNGVNLGYLLTSDYYKVKALAGMFYAGSSFQQTIINFNGGVAANFYLLRLAGSDLRTFEPYITSGATRQQFNFYGGSIFNDNNQSVSEERYLGNVSSWQASVGIGSEFQLENDLNQFVHFFAEIKYNAAFGNAASTKALNGTSFQPAFTFTLGINIR
ncbi:MAG: hypothetical protein K1X47_11710 [Cyclobacteriaceae bacterium]|nr:hypothetical protein [Cyclobacteriaceae bacterium]MBX7126350.1 hypothetical protein [Cyclobacteriaceae bacterium]